VKAVMMDKINQKNMKALSYYIIIFFIHISFVACTQTNNEEAKTTDMNKLTAEEKYVILQKGTEPPFTGKYLNNKEDGIYTCKQCGAELYSSSDKFDSHCGWPSFDDEIDGAVERVPDSDGRRTEIVCANCKGHLGHVFIGEHLTQKNTRHCVNSISIDFTPVETPKYDTVYFASGCFWGTEYVFQDVEGVVSTRVGYIGGEKEQPTYEQVCRGNTGHAEAIELVFQPEIVSYRDLAKRFFETHDPTQIDRQGPDIGEQYRSEIFYTSEEQKTVSEELIQLLLNKGVSVVTQLTKATDFWDAESYHQNYYKRKGTEPYCHFYQKKF